MTTTPTVSFVLPIYNAAPYLRQALASLRWQTVTDWECVCVDDGSTDASPSILRDFAAADPRFRVVTQSNQGIVAALNAGIAAARGEWIARMDADDVSLPTRLAKQLQCAGTTPQCVALGADLLMIDPEGEPIGYQRHATEHAEIERRLLTAEAGTMAHPLFFMRRKPLLQIGGYRVEHTWAHESDLLLRMTRHGRLTNVPEVLLLYRQHAGSSSVLRRVQVRADLLEVLREAHAERGGSLPAGLDRSLSAVKNVSGVTGKWARRAARNGFYRTAWKHWRNQLAADPCSLVTARVTAEMLLRGASAMLRDSSQQPPSLPEWRAWDCPNHRAAA